MFRQYLPFFCAFALAAFPISDSLYAEESHNQFGRAVQLYSFPPFDPPSHWDNDCSQIIAAMLLRSRGQTIDREQYDELGRTLNPNQTGVTFDALLAYLNDNFRCEMLGNQGYETLWRHVNSGYPAIALIEADYGLHSVLVTGFVITPNGQLSHWILEDNGEFRGIQFFHDFERWWSCPSNPEGHYCILVYPQSSIQPLDSSSIAENLAAQHGQDIQTDAALPETSIEKETQPNGAGEQVSSELQENASDHRKEIDESDSARKELLYVPREEAVDETNGPATAIENDSVAAITKANSWEFTGSEPTPIFDINMKRFFIYGLSAIAVRMAIAFFWPRFDSFSPRLKTVQVHGIATFVEPTKWKNSGGQYVAGVLLKWQGETVDKWRYDEIGAAINSNQNGVSRPDLIRYLRESFNCRDCNNASIATLKEHIDAGLPAVALVSPKAHADTHFVIVAGYRTDQTDNLRNWLILGNGPFRGWKKHDAFEELWSGNTKIPRNYCMLISPLNKSASPGAATARDDSAVRAVLPVSPGKQTAIALTRKTA